MEVNEKKTEIIQRFLEHCDLSTHMPLGFLSTDDDVWEYPPDPEQVVNSLTEEFSAEELVASALVTMSEDGSVKLTNSLSGQRGRFIVLRDSITAEPFELLTKDGCLSPDRLPVFEVLRDGCTQHLLTGSSRALFVVFEIEDVLLLRACGIPAALASGLDTLSLEDVDQFCDSFGVACLRGGRVLSQSESEVENGNHPESHPIDPMRHLAQKFADQALDESLGVPNDTAHKASGPASEVCERLVFISWSPSHLSNAVPCQLKVVVDYFRQLDRFMGVDLSDLELWELDQETIERLRFIAERRSAEIFREALLDASDEIGTDLRDFGLEKPKSLNPTADYATAITCLQESAPSGRSLHSLGPNQRTHAWNDFQKFLNQQVINPIREYALKSDDPVERTLLMSIAELSNIFHLQTAQTGEQICRRISEGGSERMDPMPDNQFKEILGMADRLINMIKAMERCNQPRTTLVLDAQNSLRLPRSK